MMWILLRQTLKPHSLPHQGVLSHVRGHLTRFFFQIELVWSNFHQRLTACFSYIFFFTKGRNYTYISITLDVHFSWYTFPMSSHNELKFFLKDCLNYWNIQQINCISKMQIEGKSLRSTGNTYIKLRHSEEATKIWKKWEIFFSYFVAFSQHLNFT